MARHIFLTGEKRVGKSTLLQKVLAQYTGKVGGFFTVRTDAFLPDAHSVHLFCADDKPVPGASNLLFVCGVPDPHTPERFDHLGCRALAKCENCSLIVMDELGPHEANAALFHQTVLKRLDGDIPILGVLQAPAALFWPDITGHPEVKILEISEANREQEDIIESIFSVILNRQ